MKITKHQLRRIIREQDSADSLRGNVIGIITANIDGDSRYNQRLTVTHDPNTDEVTILVQDAGAVGGMDYQGPGEGRGKYHTIGKQVLPAGTNGKGLVAAIRHMIKRKADTIKMYGAPTKNFTWSLSGGGFHPREVKGLSAATANHALQRSRGLGENKVRITKGQLIRIIREERARLLKEVHPRAEQDDAYAAELENRENEVYRPETGEEYNRGDLYDMIRDFSKELTGNRDRHGSYDDLDGMDIQQLADHYQDMFQSEDYENLGWTERDPIGPGDKEFNLTRAELAPKRQGMRRRPAGSKAQRRMESKTRLKERIRRILKNKV